MMSSSISTPVRPVRPRTGAAARRRTLALPAALAAAGLLLAGCGGSDDGASPTAPAPSATTGDPSEDPTTTDPATTDPSTDGPDATEPGQGAGSGCAATDGGIPDGAATAEIVDVDGDGRADTAWITGGADRTLGVTTASGATFSAPIESESPITASAVVGIVGDDAAPIALVDLGRGAQLFSLDGCAVTQTVDQDGQPYEFDRGFGDQGTGVGCTDVDGTLQLAGLLATEESEGWTVTRTLVDLSDGGKVATNGTPEVVAEGAASSDAVVTTAQEVSCGDVVAGDTGLTEPRA